MEMGWFFKPVFTLSIRERKIRLVRFGYNRQAKPGDWISWVVSLTIWAKLFHFEKSWHQWYIVFCGMGVHFRSSAGGYES